MLMEAREVGCRGSLLDRMVELVESMRMDLLMGMDITVQG